MRHFSHLFFCALIGLSGTFSWVSGQHFDAKHGEPKVRESVDAPNAERVAPSTGGGAALLPPPPSNDDCSNAINLTVGAGCVTGTTSTASVQAGEYLCINPGGGIAPETVWYRFTATSTQMVLGVVLTNTSNCATVLAAYGPFAPGAGCLPTAGNQILCQNMGLIDPGFHPRLTGLVVGQTYLVQVQGNNCGGGSDRFANFCISVNNVAANSVPGGSSVINNCGIAFTGGTTGGHYASGTSTGANNLDNNAATSVAGASEVGDDVTFVINNASWFTFCNGNAGACNWSVTLNNIRNCLLSGLNAGVQAAVFTGTPGALTNIASSPSRIAPGSSFSSGTFSVASGACAYIMVDGFAGDECDYDLTLTNVSCPCVVLPVELAYLSGTNRPEHIELNWDMAAGENLQRFMLERSPDGKAFMPLSEVPAHETPGTAPYRYLDTAPFAGWNYYRLSVIDEDGQTVSLGTIEVFRMQASGLEVLGNMEEQNLNLFVHSPAAGMATIAVSDAQGKALFNTKIQVEAGTNRQVLNLGSLSEGMYILNFTMGEQTVTKRLAKF